MGCADSKDESPSVSPLVFGRQPGRLTAPDPEERGRPLSLIPYDLDIARVYGATQAHLEDEGRVLADADLQIAATALHHHLELVTGNLRHLRRIRGLRICTALAEARTRQQ